MYSNLSTEYRSGIISKIVHKKTNVRVKSINCTQCQTNVEHDRCLASQEKTSFEKETKSTQHFCKSCNYMTTTAIYFRKHIKLSHGPNSIVSKIIACTECEFQTLENPVNEETQ